MTKMDYGHFGCQPIFYMEFYILKIIYLCGHGGGREGKGEREERMEGQFGS